MDRNDLLFIGVGQAGNNLVGELLNVNKRYNGLFINSSLDDLKEIKNATNTFIIPNAGGTARNRDKAKEYVKDHIRSLVDEFNKFPNQKIAYFVFSFGGGTGSGITPTLINVLSRAKPNLKINIVGILPHSEESKKAHQNTIECWNEITKLDNVNTIYLIDNNKRKNKLIINKEFAELFDTFMNTTKSNKNGVIDKAEIELLGTSKGFGAIYKIADCQDEGSLSKSVANSIFTTSNNLICEYIGLSVPSNYDYQFILDVYKITEDYFIGYNDDEPVLILSGMPINNNALKNVKDALNLKITHTKEIYETLENDDDELAISIELPNPKKKNKTTKPKEEKELSIDELMENEDDFWNKIMNM